MGPSTLLDHEERNLSPAIPGPKGRFLSQEECNNLTNRVVGFAAGGGRTTIGLESWWTGNLRWARNKITTSGDTRNNAIDISRQVNGASGGSQTNEISDRRLEAVVRRAERLLQRTGESPERELVKPYMEPYSKPTLWFDRTYALEAEEQVIAMKALVKPAVDASLMAAGFIRVSAHGRAVMGDERAPAYYPFTRAEYSVTVRDPEGTASGWAGVDWGDWGRIDGLALSAIAVDKCLRSRNAVAVEPGRYTAILEPQAVADIIAPMFGAALDRNRTEEQAGTRQPYPFSADRRGYSKIGLKVADERITFSADCMDPDLGFPPFDRNGNVFNAATWIENGVLKNLAYSRSYAIKWLGKNNSLLSSGAFRMSGGPATVESMTANTKRGILVTRFSDVGMIDFLSLLLTGVTRDGLWLIENGKISKPIKNFRFTESIFVVLNNVLELGTPQRVYHPSAPIVVPPMSIQDFSFTSMTDAI